VILGKLSGISGQVIAIISDITEMSYQRKGISCGISVLSCDVSMLSCEFSVLSGELLPENEESGYS
jgi:hypothetical protein